MSNSISWLYNTPIAHRGLHTEDKTAPENTIASFQRAIEYNYAIELDVQLSKDEEVIVYHDYDLIRLCNINKKISELSWSELCGINILNSKHHIPSLKEVFKLVKGQVPILIEIKNEGKIGLLEKKVGQELDSYNGLVAIQSFNPFVISWFKKKYPHIIRGQLSSSFKGIKMNFFLKKILSNLLLNFISRPDFISYEITSLPNLITSFYRKRGVPLLGWTITDETSLALAKKHCDNIIFESIII